MGEQPHLTTDPGGRNGDRRRNADSGRNLEPATEILEALYQLDARLAHLDLDGVIPELRWDARWAIDKEAGL